jgi:hypothetical protein
MPAGQNFPDGSLVVAFNPTVVATIQDRTLQRVFRDSLFPRLLFRMEAVAELWGANLGTNQTFTRSGLIRPNTRPLRAGQDPSPKTWKVEQWEATAQQWGDSIDNHMPTNYTTLASQYLRNMHQLGLQAGQSLNRVVRDKLYNSYVAGNTVVDRVGLVLATTIVIANGNGFAFSLDPSTGRPGSISAANPVAISIPSIGLHRRDTGFAPTVAGDFIHGGTLTISPGADRQHRGAGLGPRRQPVGAVLLGRRHLGRRHRGVRPVLPPRRARPRWPSCGSTTSRPTRTGCTTGTWTPLGGPAVLATTRCSA